MNIYKLKTQACIKGLGRIDEYLKRLNFALEDYNAAVLSETKEIKYKAVQTAYEEYLTCNSQVLTTFKQLHETHLQEQSHV